MREPFGGGVARVRGARLMASGISRAQWNNADVVDGAVDVDAVVRWYEPRGVPWGMRVPVEIELDVGEPLFVKRCVALLPGTRGGAGEVRLEDDPRAYAAVEAAAFAYRPSAALEWVGPEFAHPGFRHWVAAVDGAPAAIGTTVRTDGDAGPAAHLTGLALLPGAPVAALAGLVRPTPQTPSPPEPRSSMRTLRRRRRTRRSPRTGPSTSPGSWFASAYDRRESRCADTRSCRRRGQDSGRPGSPSAT